MVSVTIIQVESSFLEEALGLPLGAGVLSTTEVFITKQFKMPYSEDLGIALRVIY